MKVELGHTMSSEVRAVRSSTSPQRSRTLSTGTKVGILEDADTSSVQHSPEDVGAECCERRRLEVLYGEG